MVALLAMISTPATWGLIAGLGLSLAMLATQPASSETIQLEPQHGVFMLPVRINDAITIPFVLDSGASGVVITGGLVGSLMMCSCCIVRCTGVGIVLTRRDLGGRQPRPAYY
jgi:hypothetical protein